MITSFEPTCTAFSGARMIAGGDLQTVALRAQESTISDTYAPVLIFDDLTGRVIEIDLRGTPEDVWNRVAEVEVSATQKTEASTPDTGARGPGRPKLGVVAREVTLLPRHWEWLGTQSGGASVALRKLVEEARRTNQGKDRLRSAQEAAYRFMSTMAGNEPGFEEAARALFRGDRESYAKFVERWPIDVAKHAKKLADRAFENEAAEPSPPCA
ncbi:MAG: DUF2239 family protein [Terracidiphilus sp.]|jgi:hypothetical protein